MSKLVSSSCLTSTPSIISGSDNISTSEEDTWKCSEQPAWASTSEKPETKSYLNQISRGPFRLATIFSILVFISLCGIFYTLTSRSNGQVEVWIAYPVAGSQGPTVQLRIEKSNTSEWMSTHGNNLDSFAFRIDDQTMIPKELLSSEETRYQEWFGKFYPQLWDVYQNGDHLDGDYLEAAPKNMIHVDLRFHLSHCVLALRRYWIAKESGKHVCSRDLHPGHIEHCLNSLDEWAFPEDGIPPEHNVWLEWITQVCEYEQ